MRIWSLHPRLLDTKGLVALWREGLLARAVLLGQTKGYKHHPQIQRWTVDTLEVYLHGVCDEADLRGYTFNRTKLNPPQTVDLVPVTVGQVDYELGHLADKVLRRTGQPLTDVGVVAHPVFRVVPGPVEKWERT